MSNPSPELVAAIGGLLQADATRIVALAASLRAPGRSIPSTVQGASMGRTLPPDSRIRIALTECARYEVGQVVAYHQTDRVVVHRIVHRCASGRSAGHVLTRGDATLVPDPPVPLARILGAVALELEGGQLQTPSPAPVRSVRAALVSWLLLRAAIAMLRLGPGATATVLTTAYRTVTRCRSGIDRLRRLRQVAPRSL